jgi:hypothetical protein
MDQSTGRRVPRIWQRKQIVEILRKAGYWKEADEASQTLPESVDFARLERFCVEEGISRDDLVSRMGGSS